MINLLDDTINGGFAYCPATDAMAFGAVWGGEKVPTFRANGGKARLLVFGNENDRWEVTITVEKVKDYGKSTT